MTATRRAQEAARRAANEAMATDPGWQAVASAFWDEQCGELRDGDAPMQRERLCNDGWTHRERNNDGIGVWDHRDRGLRILHSLSREADGQVWAHVSVSRRSGLMPSWDQVRDAGWLLYPRRFGIIVVAPKASHVNRAEVGHVWYCLTAASCPDFSHGLGTI
jgi:hypothetical protein